LRSDETWHRGAETLAIGERARRALQHLFAPEVLALGDVDHLFGDDAGAGPFELRQRFFVGAAQRRIPPLERARQPRAGVAVVLLGAARSTTCLFIGSPPFGSSGDLG